MYDELSRLLAGELDPEAERALQARIAGDPALAAAWERMNALPDALAALPLAPPPPALLARLHAMVPVALDAHLDAEPEPALDPAPFAPDPREDTLETPFGRPDTGVRSAAVLPRARVERTVAVRPAPRPTVGRAWVLAGATVGLAIGLVTGGLLPPGAPAGIALVEGDSVIDGDVQVRAGDLDLHVRGRARISVTPPVDTSLTHTRAAELVYVPRPTRAATTTRALAEGPPATSVTEPSGMDAPHSAATPSAPPLLLGSGVPAREGHGFVTVRVERGTVDVARPRTGGLRVTTGETRSFTLYSPEGALVPQVPGGGASETSPDPARSTPREILAHRDLELPGGRPLGRIETSLDADRSVSPTGAATAGQLTALEALLLDVETAVDGVTLTGFECAPGPCVAVYAGPGAEPGWRDLLPELLAEELGEEFEVFPAFSGDKLALVLGPVDAPPDQGLVDHHLGLALDGHRSR